MDEKTKNELIKKAGGVANVARGCMVTKNAVYKWKGIPAHHHLVLIDLAKAEGKKISIMDFYQK